MRIDSSIPVHRTALTPAGYGMWPPRHVQPPPRIERRIAARPLPPQKLGDAAQLTLLVAQAMAVPITAGSRHVADAYAEADERGAIFEVLT